MLLYQAEIIILLFFGKLALCCMTNVCVACFVRGLEL